MICAKCNSNFDALKYVIFCPKCHHLQPYDRLNYMKVFHIKNSIIQPESVFESIINLKKALHPDNFIEQEQDIVKTAAYYYMDISEFEREFKSIAERIDLILLHFYKISDQGIVVATSILSEVMSLQEEADALHSKKNMRLFKTKIKQKIASTIKAINFNNLERAQQLKIYIQYLEKILDRIKDKEC